MPASVRDYLSRWGDIVAGVAISVLKSILIKPGNPGNSGVTGRRVTTEPQLYGSTQLVSLK